MRSLKGLVATSARTLVFGNASAFNFVVVVYLSAEGLVTELAAYGLAISITQLAYGLMGLNLYAPSIAAKSIGDYWLLRSPNILALPLIFFILIPLLAITVPAILAPVILRVTLNCVDITSISMLYKKRLWAAFSISATSFILAVTIFMFFGILEAFFYGGISLVFLIALLFLHAGFSRTISSIAHVYREYYWNGIIAFQMAGQNALPRIVLSMFGPEYVALHVQLTSLIAPVSLLARSLNFDVLRDARVTLTEKSRCLLVFKRQSLLFAVICLVLFVLLAALTALGLFPYPQFTVWDITFGVAAILFTSIGSLISGFLKAGGLAREEFFLLVATLVASCFLFFLLAENFGAGAVAPALAAASLITAFGRLAVILRSLPLPRPA